MVKAVKALNSSASKGQENTIPLQKKKIITIIIIFKLHFSKGYFGLEHCTPKLFSLQNYINKTREKKMLLQKKKNQQKRNALFPQKQCASAKHLYIFMYNCRLFNQTLKIPNQSSQHYINHQTFTHIKSSLKTRDVYTCLYIFLL